MRVALLCLLLLSPLFPLVLGFGQSLPSGSELTYQVSFSLNALLFNQQGTGVVVQHVLNETNSTVLFSTLGYGNIYSMASKDKANLTAYFLMEMYNGTYNKSVGLGNGFPMFSSSELESLKAGDFQANGSEVTVVECNFTTPKGTFPAYRVNLIESEAIGTGNITLWVNASNGVIMQEYIEASTFLGSATIIAKLVNWSIPLANTSTVNTSTPTSSTSSTATSTVNTSTPTTSSTSSSTSTTLSITTSTTSSTSITSSIPPSTSSPRSEFPILVPVVALVAAIAVSLLLLRRK